MMNNQYDSYDSSGRCKCPGQFVIRNVKAGRRRSGSDEWSELAIKDINEHQCRQICNGILNCVGYNFHRFKRSKSSEGSCFLLSNSESIKRHNPYQCTPSSYCIGFLNGLSRVKRKIRL